MKNKELEEKYLKVIEKLNKKYFVGRYMTYSEEYHVEWDDLIIEFLKESGYKKIAKKYEKATNNFWYS